MAQRRNATFTLRGLKAAGASRAKFSQDYGVVNKIERNIEAEIKREKKQPISKIHRFRRTGEVIFRHRLTLLVIVILNVIECVLILSELIIDVHWMQEMVELSATSTDTFILSLQSEYPAVFQDVEASDIGIVYHKILVADISWGNYSHYAIPQNAKNISDFNETLKPKESPTRHSRSSEVYIVNYANTNSKDKLSVRSEKNLPFNLHIASMSILCLLVVVTVMKVFCYGLYFVKKKLQIFDSFVVLFSIVLDIAFIKIHMDNSVESVVLILTFLVPWRVIRVVNNLIITVKHQAHFKLKLIYNEKNIADKTMKEIRQQKKDFKNTIEVLEQLCLKAGVTQEELERTLMLYSSVLKSYSTKKRKGQIEHGGFKTMSSCFCLATDQRKSLPYGHAAQIHHASDYDSAPRLLKSRRLSKSDTHLI